MNEELLELAKLKQIAKELKPLRLSYEDLQFKLIELGLTSSQRTWVSVMTRKGN